MVNTLYELFGLESWMSTQLNLIEMMIILKWYINIHTLSLSLKTFLLPMLLLCSNKVGRAVGGEAGDELLGGVVGDRTSRLGVDFRDLWIKSSLS